MSVVVRIPTPLRKMTQNEAEVSAEGSDIASLIDDLENNYPGIKDRVAMNR